MLKDDGVRLPGARRADSRPRAAARRRRDSRSARGAARASLPLMIGMRDEPTTTGTTALLLNVAHALDHMFLLIFATAVGDDRRRLRLRALGRPDAVRRRRVRRCSASARCPPGRLGDLWGRREMMLVFFFGMGVSMLLVALTQGPWQLAAALTLIGAFASIYHPVGIPMLVRGAPRPGLTIGVNGLAGNLGVALSAVATGFLVKYAGWRAAFAVPALDRDRLRHRVRADRAARADGAGRRTRTQADLPADGDRSRASSPCMTIASVTASLLFNFTTNGNGELLRERFAGIVEDPAMLGVLLALVYVVGSFAQVAVGLLIDRVPLKRLYVGIVALQVPLFALAATGAGLGALRADDRAS